MFTALVPHVGGPIAAPGAPTVLIGFLPAARMTDMAVCVGPPDMIAMGSPTVLIEFLMAARLGDPTAHGGVIVLGFPMVEIGEAGMGSPSTVVVTPGAGGGGGAAGLAGSPGSGPSETQGKGIGAGASRTDTWTPGQLVVAGDAEVMQSTARAIRSAPAQALASGSASGTAFIEPCPG
jgi:uncharacterized Zn-binding protein involved in type VI secretion